MKKIITAFLCVILCALATLPSFADSDVSSGELPLLIDNAELLSNSEESKLNAKLEQLRDSLSCDVIVLTEAEITDDAESYADGYFDYNGYGQGDDFDGILLLVSMSPRRWHISGSGICNSKYITSSVIEGYIGENISELLGNGEYYECFNEYTDRCEELISLAREGKRYREPFNIGVSLIISVAVGFVIAFIVTGVMKGQLKSVRYQSGANNYVKEDSLKISDARDLLLYRRVSATRKPENTGSGSHRSSSGRSHSGAGGRF